MRRVLHAPPQRELPACVQEYLDVDCALRELRTHRRILRPMRVQLQTSLRDVLVSARKSEFATPAGTFTVTQPTARQAMTDGAPLPLTWQLVQRVASTVEVSSPPLPTS